MVLQLRKPDRSSSRRGSPVAKGGNFTSKKIPLFEKEGPGEISVRWLSYRPVGLNQLSVLLKHR